MKGGLFIFLSMAVLIITAQEKCATVAPSSGAFENWIKLKQKESSQRSEVNTQLATVYEIPIVVHVFHKGENIGDGVNLSEERIKAQIDSLTADFRRRNADTLNTPDAFLSVASDIEIEFVLAKQDPAGNPTNGIVRMQGSLDRYRANSHRKLLRSESYWPPEHYLNIYVLDLQVFLGYASFPIISLDGITNDTEDFEFDGVLIDYEYFGVNPGASAFESYGRTLTHEVGHFLGLRHIWGDGNCSKDDFVEDTPLADADNGDYTSPCTFPNPNDNEVCVSGEPEMFQNFMDYTDDICMNLFTQGQKSRMRTVMDNALNRASLTTSPGLIAPVQVENDLALVKVKSPGEVICTTNIAPELSVTNYGTNEITSFRIRTLLNGTMRGTERYVVANLPPLASQTINYSAFSVPTAPYTLTFEITEVNEVLDENGDNNIKSLTVKANSPQALPFTENFEGSLSVLGENGIDFPWQVATAPKETSSNQALVFKSYENSQWFGEETIFKTPILDLTEIQSGEILFSYSHANAADAFFDGLMLKASLDCGETFTDILFSSFGPNLSTAHQSNDFFTPANQLEWVDTLVSITDYRGIDGVQFAFVGLNGGGNNIYVDDIRIEETILSENDINLQKLSGPLITCAESSLLELRIRNVGSQIVTSFEAKYYINGDTSLISFDRLDISSKDYATFFINADNLLEGSNNIGAEVISVNGGVDESEVNNSFEITLIRDLESSEYPLALDFTKADNWDIVSESDPLWERTIVQENPALRANGFNAAELGKKSFFISPALSTGNLDSANLSFRVSYASRDGFTDQLEVLLSVDCGENYTTTLLDAFSDSLAVTSSSSEWIPTIDEDWKEYNLKLPHSFPNEDIKIAFVFTPGGGNDLYVDDISITKGNVPTYEELMRVYPNPATASFNVGFNLPEKESVTVRLIDMTGRIIFEEAIGNALNQSITYKTPSQKGIYFLNVIGSQFNVSQKLFINR